MALSLVPTSAASCSFVGGPSGPAARSMTQREAADVLGVGAMTVSRDLRGVPDETPEPHDQPQPELPVPDGTPVVEPEQRAAEELKRAKSEAHEKAIVAFGHAVHSLASYDSAGRAVDELDRCHRQGAHAAHHSRLGSGRRRRSTRPKRIAFANRQPPMR